jgi:hypothetical protein
MIFFVRGEAVKARVELRIKTIGNLALGPGQNRATGKRLLILDTGTVAYSSARAIICFERFPRVSLVLGHSKTQRIQSDNTIPKFIGLYAIVISRMNIAALSLARNDVV